MAALEPHELAFVGVRTGMLTKDHDCSLHFPDAMLSRTEVRHTVCSPLLLSLLCLIPTPVMRKRSCNVFEMFTLYCRLRLKQNLEREDQRERTTERHE